MTDRPKPALDRETILAATEEVLRRHGAGKAGVVDVARALGVSHAAVYRYFTSKTALRDAVARRFLNRSRAELVAIADGPGPAPERLKAWLWHVFTTKRAAVTADPELFETYRTLLGEEATAAGEHVTDLLSQLTRIVAGFGVPQPERTAWAVFDATTSFHHPAHSAEWSAPDAEERFTRVCGLVLAALTRETGTTAPPL
ncbi:TetR family transcriptional regulator [Amycolatopsis sp. NPDC051061]|uniref:TetR/AcrR family transcriptional regulator n=1 Tax=Amycolatopsis sp. NPDC051061 TaxID=3155042 RepID=UPI00343BB309